MKRFLIALLSVLLVLSLCACTTDKKDDTNKETENNEQNAVSYASSLEILETVWGTYAEDEMFFAIGGIPFTETVTENAPGAVDVALVDDINANFAVTADTLADVEDAASLVHGMIANNFTAVCYGLKDGADVAAFCDNVKADIEGNQWICGFPEKYLIVTVGDEYAIAAYGASDILSTFETKVAENIEGATTVYNNALQ